MIDTLNYEKVPVNFTYFSVFTYSAAPTPYHSLFIEVLQEKVVAVAALLKNSVVDIFS